MKHAYRDTDNPLISVIIPVYNVEQYLQKCVDSVIAQTYCNLEIILVDDGSTDSSGRICDQYAQNDSRIRVIHKENGGLSDARNAGIMAMNGEFFSFVDSDDYIQDITLKKLYGHICEDGSDISICCAKKVIEDQPTTGMQNENIKSVVFNREEVLFKMLARRIPMYAVGKLFRTEKMAHMRFPVGRKFEDVPTVWKAAQCADFVSFTDSELYYYRQRQDSIVNEDYNHSRMDQLLFSEEILNSIGKNEPLYRVAETRCFFAAADNLALVTNEYPDDKRYLIEAMKKYRQGVLLDDTSGLKLKILAFLSCIHPKLVRRMGILYKRTKQLKMKNKQFRWKMSYQKK